MIYRRNRFWHLRIRKHGRLIQRSTREIDARKALAAARRILAQMFEQGPPVKYRWNTHSTRDRLTRLVKDGKLGKPCADCKGTFPPCAMDYDHLPQFRKVDTISQLVRWGSPHRVFAELAKCELVCKNCHAIRTQARIDARRASKISTAVVRSAPE